MQVNASCNYDKLHFKIYHNLQKKLSNKDISINRDCICVPNSHWSYKKFCYLGKILVHAPTSLLLMSLVALSSTLAILHDVHEFSKCALGTRRTVESHRDPFAHRRTAARDRAAAFSAHPIAATSPHEQRGRIRERRGGGREPHRTAGAPASDGRSRVPHVAVVWHELRRWPRRFALPQKRCGIHVRHYRRLSLRARNCFHEVFTESCL